MQKFGDNDELVVERFDICFLKGTSAYIYVVRQEHLKEVQEWTGKWGRAL